MTRLCVFRVLKAGEHKMATFTFQERHLKNPDGTLSKVNHKPPPFVHSVLACLGECVFKRTIISLAWRPTVVCRGLIGALQKKTAE